jgi:hypothetical protein
MITSGSDETWSHQASTNRAIDAVEAVQEVLPADRLDLSRAVESRKRKAPELVRRHFRSRFA